VPHSQVAQSQVAQSQVAQSQVAQLEVAQLEVAQAQVPQLPVAQSQVAQAQVAQAQVAQAQVAQAQVAHSQVARSQIPQKRNTVGEDSETLVLESEHSSVNAVVQNQLAHQLRCIISEEIKADLLRLAEVLGICNPEGNLEILIGKAAKLALRTSDPALRKQKSLKQSSADVASPSAKQSKSVAMKESQFELPIQDPLNPVMLRCFGEGSPKPGNCFGEGSPKPGNCFGEAPHGTERWSSNDKKSDQITLHRQGAERTRYIAINVKRRLLAKADYQCQFVSHEGKRCCQKTALQVDHIHAFSRGGSNDPENLQILCPLHNRRKYERECGEALFGFGSQPDLPEWRNLTCR
jgi:multidrug efflux pump subunit AcrA (membrane-fusion protein)